MIYRELPRIDFDSLVPGNTIKPVDMDGDVCLAYPLVIKEVVWCKDNAVIDKIVVTSESIDGSLKLKFSLGDGLYLYRSDFVDEEYERLYHLVQFV